MTKLKKILLLITKSKILLFFMKKPYILFFSVLYGCLLSKFYINQKINNLYKEEKLLKSHKTQLNKLELEYNQIIYEYLKD
jgi:hypothetical protein